MILLSSAATRPDAAQPSAAAVCLRGRLPRELGELRRFEHLKVAQDGNDLWIRADDIDDELRVAIAKVSGAEQFHLSEEGQLTPWAAQLPIRRLPRLSWQPICQAVSLELPPASYPGSLAERGVVSLVRSTAYAPPNVLQATFTEFAEFALRAPLVRLRRWRFAVASDGRAMICGEPLPPIGGRLYVETCGIAIEAGWSIAPPVDARVLAQSLEVSPGELIVLQGDGSCERIAADDFVAVSRSAIRETLEAIDG